MAFSPISWAYKEEATATKLQQMVENLLAHDHRSDGSQGAPLVGEWVAAGVTAASGFSLLGAQRYRLLLGGLLVQYDFGVTRTGATLTGGTSAATKPGGLIDTVALTGIPAEAQLSGFPFVIEANNTIVHAYASGGSITLTSTVPWGEINAGDGMRFRGVAWRE